MDGRTEKDDYFYFPDRVRPSVGFDYKNPDPFLGAKAECSKSNPEMCSILTSRVGNKVIV